MSGAVEKISKAVAVRLSAFVALYDRVCESKHSDVGTIIRTVLKVTGFREWLIDRILALLIFQNFIAQAR
jgi:hypothetical protein